MMVAIGNFFFRYRNGVFPLVLVLCLFRRWPVFPAARAECWAVTAGIAVALLGQFIRAVTIGLAYIKRGGKDKKVYADTLVQEGIFAHCRNPLYLGNLLIITGVGIAANSLLFVLIGLPFFYFAYFAIIAAEENFLRGKFGGEYADYCRRVPRLIPRLAGLGATLQSMEFHWRRLLVKEYGTAFWWTAGVTVIIAKNHWLRIGTENRDPFLAGAALVLALLAAGFLTAWLLKKTKVVRAN